jgi:hypothetical protein
MRRILVDIARAGAAVKRGGRGKRRDGRLETRSVLRIVREHIGSLYSVAQEAKTLRHLHRL